VAPEPGANPDAMTSEFEGAIRRIGESIAEAVKGFNDLIGDIKKWAWALGAPVMLWIKNKMDDVREGLQKLIEKVQWVVEHAGGVPSLIITSFKWLSMVQTPASLIAGQIGNKDLMLSYWEGQAATVYGERSTAQAAAATDMATKADFISTWLFTIAKGNVEYAVKAAENISMLAGELTQAAIDAGGVLTILEAVNTLAGAVGSLVENALNMLFNIANQVVDALQKMRDVNASMGNKAAMTGPGGTWPQAVNV
jgi:hypothetical protein